MLIVPGPASPAMHKKFGQGAISMAEAIRHRTAGQEIMLLVGPEGGYTDSERTAILSASFLPVRIGSTVLRIETAAIALLAAVAALEM